MYLIAAFNVVMRQWSTIDLILCDKNQELDAEINNTMQMNDKISKLKKDIVSIVVDVKK